MNTKSLFRQISSLVVVRNLQSPVPFSYDVSTSLQTICEENEKHCLICEGILEGNREELQTIVRWLAVITNENTAIGYLDFADEQLDEFLDELELDVPFETTTREIMRPIAPPDIITADTSLFDAVTAFADQKKPFYFVIDKQSITGVLFYRDLFKPLGKLAFFSLVQELELAAIELCYAFAKECFSALPKQRREKAIETIKTRYGDPSARKRAADKAFGTKDGVEKLVIDSTTFIDKKQTNN